MIELKVSGEIPEIESDFSSAMKGVADLMERAIQLNFSMGGRPSPWPALKPPRSGTPLVATGRFYRSIQSSHGPTWAMVEAGGNFNDVRIPMIHQYGGFAGRNLASYIPPRSYMVLTQHDLSQIAEKIGHNIFKISVTKPQFFGGQGII